MNPAYAAATVYFTAVVAVLYNFSVEANQQLLKAQLKKDDLQLIINTQIIPILELLERLHSKGDMENFCKAKSTIIVERCENALTSLQNVRKDIEQQMLDSVSGIGKNKVLQWITGATGGLAGIGIGVMVMNPPAIAFGLSALVWGFVGFGVGYNNIKSYEDAMLEEARQEIVEIETTIGNALTKADIFCVIFPSFQEQLKSLEDLKLATTRLESKKSKPELRNEL